jgi:hypothetical protein
MRQALNVVSLRATFYQKLETFVANYLAALKWSKKFRNFMERFFL